MLTKFAEGLGGKLADYWMTTMLTPAFVFWAGGVSAWAQCHGWEQLFDWFNTRPRLMQLELLVGGLLVVAASGIVIQQFDLAVLRLLEGYWPGRLRRLRRRLIDWRDRSITRAEARLQELAKKHERKELTLDEREELSALDWRLMSLPPYDMRMPTRLGNILRAAEVRPLHKYGLDAVICWPRLWLLLPESVKGDLTGARDKLDNAARLWLWGVLFLVWTVWSWWAVPVSLLTILVAHRWLLSSAEVYGSLLESTFDLFRGSLYKSLRWPLPSNPGEERKFGEDVTAYFWRGSDSSSPNFLPPPTEAGKKGEG